MSNIELLANALEYIENHLDLEITTQDVASSGSTVFSSVYKIGSVGSSSVSAAESTISARLS